MNTKTTSSPVAVNDYISKYAPDLAQVAATFEPFKDVISSVSAGPQPQASDYDPTEPQYFQIYFPSGSFGEEASARISLVDGELEVLVHDEACDRVTPTTLEAVWNHLRQLPRPVSSFVR